MKKCIFQERFRYDPCRSCNGFNLNCPNRLEEFKYSKDIEHTRIDADRNRNKSQQPIILIHVGASSESYSKTQQIAGANKYTREGSIPSSVESYSRPNHTPQRDINAIRAVEAVPSAETLGGEKYRPVEFRRLNLLEAQATTRYFLQRFRRYQR